MLEPFALWSCNTEGEEDDFIQSNHVGDEFLG